MSEPERIIGPSDSESEPFMLDLSVLALSRFYATAEEALELAAWLDHMVGGGSDLAEQIREAVGP